MPIWKRPCSLEKIIKLLREAEVMISEGLICSGNKFRRIWLDLLNCDYVSDTPLRVNQLLLEHWPNLKSRGIARAPIRLDTLL